MTVEAKMKAVLDELDFDFSQFTMDSFVDWIERSRGRKIRFIHWEMPPGMFGVWMSDADEPIEHVFIDNSVPPMHQVHIQLHELSHILCAHPTARLSRHEMGELLFKAAEDPGVLNEVLLRAPAKKELEEEAEIMAALIQHQVIRHERLQQLGVAASSNEGVIDHLSHWDWFKRMWDKVIIATLAWFVTIYKFDAMRRDGQWRTGSVTFYFWAFSFFTSIGLTLMIWPVYLAFDRLVGLANLGWLVIYVSFALAIYFISAGCYIVLEQPKPRLMSWSLLLTVVVLTVVYAVGIVTLPEKADHTVPEVLAEVIFMQTIYTYVAILCAIPMLTFIRLARHEQIVSARLRWLVGFFASFFSFTVLLIKIVLTVLAFQNPATPALTILYPLITVGIVAVSIFITLAFLPNKLYQAAAQPFEFLDKLLALFELKSLQNRLDPLCPPVVTGRLRLKDVLGDLDYHLYRTLIAIWDAKKTLSGYAGLTHDLTLLPVTAIHSPGRNLPEWDARKLQQARLLHDALQTVDDEQPFTALVKSYQRVSRIVRRKMGVNFSLGGTALDVVYQN